MPECSHQNVCFVDKMVSNFLCQCCKYRNQIFKKSEREINILPKLQIESLGWELSSNPGSTQSAPFLGRYWKSLNEAQGSVLTGSGHGHGRSGESQDVPMGAATKFSSYRYSFLESFRFRGGKPKKLLLKSQKIEGGNCP